MISNLAYLAASVLFILGLKQMAHPRTAVRGNLLGALGMLIAVAATLMDRAILDTRWILVGLAIGSLAGAVLANRVRMTAMPQFVALLNGLGGAASALVAGAYLIEETARRGMLPADVLVATALSGLVGAVTFWGSLVAFGKLQEILFTTPLAFPGLQAVNAVLALAAAGLGAWVVHEPGHPLVYWALVTVSSLLGVLLVAPIGGADMPVVISLLNSYSGIAAAATGFVVGNSVLIITGSLVGASGIVLTRIMCKAMNRSLLNVLFGRMGPGGGSAPAEADAVYGGKVKSASPEEIALLFEGARRVAIVPGYGLAVSQAQHAVRDLASLLESRGAEVFFAIHPVAGRMPGHMNVLLAEANIPYDKLKEMDEANALFEQTDVALVVGANDVVNPLARQDPQSPIAGMPVLEADRARTVVVVKRSLSPGFAGIPNPLFALEKTLMLFEDGKKGLLQIVAALKETA